MHTYMNKTKSLLLKIKHHLIKEKLCKLIHFVEGNVYYNRDSLGPKEEGGKFAGRSGRTPEGVNI